MTDIKIEEYYMREAKDLVNLLYDKRFLNDDLNLASVEWLVDYLGFVIQSKTQMAAKSAVLMARMRDKQ